MTWTPPLRVTTPMCSPSICPMTVFLLKALRMSQVTGSRAGVPIMVKRSLHGMCITMRLRSSPVPMLKAIPASRPPTNMTSPGAWWRRLPRTGGRGEPATDSKAATRLPRDAKQMGKGNGYFTVLVYDDRDRVTRTGEVRGSPGGCTFSTPDAVVPDSELHLLSETVYGMPTVAGLLARDASLDRSM